ncbi:MAG: alpha-L-fucosidase [Phycisphaerae bacterium]
MNTDWLKDARYGCFMHFLPDTPATFDLVGRFDVDVLAEQLEAMGAKYFGITLGQNSGYFVSPNSVYDACCGYRPGERCSTRDLPLDLYAALHAKGIRLMLYLPCQVPNGDAKAQAAFGLPVGRKDQPLDLALAEKWGQVIREWSVRYGDKAAGWWFDGGYEHIGFNDEMAAVYAQAVKQGNPQAIVTFNPGVKLVRGKEAEDYTAGELNEPLAFVPKSRWLEGSQWHVLTFLGSYWAQRDTRYSDEEWIQWMKDVVHHGGAVTLDVGPNWDMQLGAIGSLAEAQINQLKAIRAALGE